MTTNTPLPNSLSQDQLINVKTVGIAVGLGRSAIYDRVSKGEFPQPIRLGHRCTRWRVADVQAWIAQAAQIAKAVA